eukprot:TRINITY_DN57_c0_g1_i1.p1 TRINITY_DN57_c0_g1~~TRINITY_DN57_c0_g1_i1.p1  ORF type:complete len:301 (+),score=71.50 TRINITY_DN57_c0_g1_i1:81-905(+)
MGHSMSTSCEALPPCGPYCSAGEEVVVHSPKAELPRLLGYSHQEDALLFGPAARKEQKTLAAVEKPEGFFPGPEGEDSANIKQDPEHISSGQEREDAANPKQEPEQLSLGREGEDSADLEQEPEQLSSRQNGEVFLVPEVENPGMPALVPISTTDADKEARKAERKRRKMQARNQILPFLMKNGFKTVKSQKSSCWRVSYPLHAAVKQNDAESVRLLLKAHANPKAVDSMGRTPLELASQLNRRGTHVEVMALLRTKKGRKPKCSEGIPVASDC